MPKRSPHLVIRDTELFRNTALCHRLIGHRDDLGATPRSGKLLTPPAITLHPLIEALTSVMSARHAFVMGVIQS